MTATASTRRERPRDLPAAFRAAVALIAAVTMIVVGLAGLFATAASARTLRRPETGVGASGLIAGQVVGAHEPVLAGQRRARAPSYDRTAVGSCVAAETEPVLSATGDSAATSSSDAGETVRRFVRQDEFDAIQKAISGGEDQVQVGRFFTPDAISSPSVAAQQLSLPGTDVNPLVGYFDMPASSLPSEPFSTFGPRLVAPDFFQPGGGLEMEVSDLYGRPVVPTSGLTLEGF